MTKGLRIKTPHKQMQKWWIALQISQGREAIHTENSNAHKRPGTEWVQSMESQKQGPGRQADEHRASLQHSLL